MVERVIEYCSVLGEGPVWDVENESICWIDIPGGDIHEFSPENKIHRTTHVHQMIGSVAICSDGNFIAAMKNGFGIVDRKSGVITTLGNPEQGIQGNRFNDGKIDPAGRFWAGTMSHVDEPGMGSLYTLEGDLTISKKINAVSISNGLAWSADHRTFYYIDTPTFLVVAFDFDKKTGAISNKRTVIRIPEENGSPDGMTIDNEGMLWIAHWDGWQISRWNPLTGKKILSIPVPAARVTSCCFGGKNFTDLYITTAMIGLAKDQLDKQPLAGSLFVVRDIGYTGLPADIFKLEGNYLSKQ